MSTETAGESIAITINGESAEVRGDSVADVLAALGFDLAYAAVAVNESVVFRQDLRDTTLRDGDRVEVVSPMSGG